MSLIKPDFVEKFRLRQALSIIPVAGTHCCW
jgi:hypothetical protein